MIAKCVAYTFEQSKLSCILHSSIENGQKYARGKQTGFKKPDYILPLLEISYCSETNRKRRCRSEPKCNQVDCLRNAPERELWEPWQSTWFKRLKPLAVVASSAVVGLNCFHLLELIKRKIGYDAGYAKDEYGCNKRECECAHFDQAIIGKRRVLLRFFKCKLRWYCYIWTNC